MIVIKEVGGLFSFNNQVLYYLLCIGFNDRQETLITTGYFRYTLTLLISVPFICQAAESQITSEQYLGAGVSRISIQSGHPSIGDQSISGLSVVYGIRRYNHVFEMTVGGGDGVNVGPTYDIYYPEDKADYGYFSLVYHYQFRGLVTSTNIVPYLGGGYSFNSINWQNYVYDHSGEGYALVAGVLLPVDNRLSLNVSFTRQSYSGSRILFSSSDYESYTTSVNLFTVNFVYHFTGGRIF